MVQDWGRGDLRELVILRRGRWGMGDVLSEQNWSTDRKDISHGAKRSGSEKTRWRVGDN
jgi:hypothetical protein